MHNEVIFFVFIIDNAYAANVSLLMLIGFGGGYVLIYAFHDDDNDGDKYIYNLESANLAR